MTKILTTVQNALSKKIRVSSAARNQLMQRFMKNHQQAGHAIEHLANIETIAAANSIANSFRHEGAQVKINQNLNGKYEVAAAFGPETRVFKKIQTLEQAAAPAARQDIKPD